MKSHLNQLFTISALLLAIAALGVGLWSNVRAQESSPQAANLIPTTINYQGYLRQPDGSLTNGTYDITANLYNVAASGSSVYSTTLTAVTVRDGLFNIVLGDDPPISESVFANAPLYIGISLNDLPELIPRQRLHAVPWAFQASTLVNNAQAQTVRGLTSNGAVTVNGDTVLNGDATVSGDTTIGGNAAISGDAAISGNATVNGDIALNGKATISGSLLITGTLAHPNETFIGPHFLDPVIVVRPWGNCDNVTWTSYPLPSRIPSGATAVILEYAAADAYTAGASIWVRIGEGTAAYRLAYVKAFGGGDDIGWAGQGIYPFKDDGVNRLFQYSTDGNLGNCQISLIGYFK